MAYGEILYQVQFVAQKGAHFRCQLAGLARRQNLLNSRTQKIEFFRVENAVAGHGRGFLIAYPVIGQDQAAVKADT